MSALHGKQCGVHGEYRGDVLGSVASFQFNSEAGRNSGGMGQQQGNPIFCLYSKDEEVYTGDVPTSDNSVTIAGAS